MMNKRWFSFNRIILCCIIFSIRFIYSQPLQVISISPSFNEIANEISPAISVEFNIPINPATFDSISFSVFGERSAYHSGNLNFSNENKVVSFNSYQNFNAGERVTVSLSGKILSADDFICGTNPDSIPTNIGELINTTWTLKVLLVEFSDIKHKSPGFTYDDFNNLFSLNNKKNY